MSTEYAALGAVWGMSAVLRGSYGWYTKTSSKILFWVLSPCFYDRNITILSILYSNNLWKLREAFLEASSVYFIRFFGHNCYASSQLIIASCVEIIKIGLKVHSSKGTESDCWIEGQFCLPKLFIVRLIIVQNWGGKPSCPEIKCWSCLVPTCENQLFASLPTFNDIVLVGQNWLKWKYLHHGIDRCYKTSLIFTLGSRFLDLITLSLKSIWNLDNYGNLDNLLCGNKENYPGNNVDFCKQKLNWKLCLLC